MGLVDLAIPGVQVLDELGRGIHGTVYRVKRNGRYYALKVPRSAQNGEGGPHLAARFLKEAIALARVRHSALPSVMEVGVTQGVPYLIMELVAGETLAERLRRGPLEDAQIVELGAQLSEVLTRIHEAGLVHRDIKPHNILFDSMNAAVRLIDFGYAENTSLPAPIEPKASHDTTTIGDAARDVQNDLRAVGSVLFHAATGFLPFVDVDPRPLLDRGGENTSLLPGFSPKLAKVLRRLLLSETAVSYPDARALAEDFGNAGTTRDGTGRQGFAPSSPSHLFGRQREMDRLRAALESSVSGTAQIVIVRGQAGSGKTRLVRSLLESLRHSHKQLVATCEQSEREPLAAIRKLLEAELAEIEQQPPSAKLRAIGRFRELASDVAPLLRLLSPQLSHVLRAGVPGRAKDDVATVTDEALANFMARVLSEGPPRVILIDDIQWLDAGSRRVFGHLSSISTPRVLYLLAGRDDAASWPALERILRTLDTERVWELALDPLDEHQVGEFLRSYFETDCVAEELVRYVVGVSDGTPLNILQVLHSVLEGGALVPYWGEWRFDASAASSLELPRGSIDLLTQRIRRLDPRSTRLLKTAAVSGMSFDTALLARACSIAEVDVATALNEACHSLLLQADGSGYRFFHDSVREALSFGLDERELRETHQALAEAIDQQPGATASAQRAEEAPGQELAASLDLEDPDVFEAGATRETYRLANHYASGDLEQKPRRALEICLKAGDLAFRAFDNDLAQRFFWVARQCADILSIDLGLSFEQNVAEVELRTGNLDRALKRLSSIAARATDPVERARAFSRIAWAEMQIDVERAWQAIFAGFRALDVTPPTGSFYGLVRAIGAWLHWMLAPHRKADQKSRLRLQVLCQLNDQSARLAANTARPSRLLQAVLSNLRQAEALGTPKAVSSAYLSYSFVLTALGLHRAGRRYLQRAEDLARSANDPTAYAYALQLHAVISAWAGDSRESAVVGARLLEEYGHWRDLSDYCLTAYNQQQIESLRGRNLEAWKWLEHALSKLGKHEGPALTLEFLELSIRASLTALGRRKDIPAVLSRIANVSTRPPSRGAIAETTHATRVRIFTESGQLDDGFEQLVEEVRRLRLDPRKVHLTATEYYVHVAHARVHQCLREPEDPPKSLDLLKAALRELKLAARMPLFHAHARAIDAYVAYFKGDLKKAETLFSRAYQLGASEGAPWVLYAVHRGRAHLLRRRGISEAAADEARLAEALAREHGAAYRMHWIREEFSLVHRGVRGSSDVSPVSSLSPVHALLDGARRPASRGHLKSLVRIGQHTAKEFGLAQQAKIVLAELIEASRAERGFLFLTQERLADETEQLDGSDTSALDKAALHDAPLKRMIPVAAQNTVGRDLPMESSYNHEFVEDTLARSHRSAAPDDNSLPNVVTTTHDGRHVMAAALMIRGERMGAVYLDRSQHLGAFSETDSRTLAALAIQVPLVFELARFLRERERAEEAQRSEDKLEAIGRLAGGIAHDFNNMLSVILGISDQILGQKSSRSVADDIRTVQSAAERARDLTRQLLAFSRGQYLRPEVLQLNDLVARLQPIFAQLLGEKTRLVLDLDDDLCRVKADPAQIDQVLTNLVVNAHDAMSHDGHLLIQTSNFILSPGREADELRLPPGRYAQIKVVDNGVGMDVATLAKIFEPFFTTKPAGSGLGLPTAYGIVKQSGGHIDAESRLGKGTTFRILLPETEQRLSVPAPSQRPEDRTGNETVLLVDDEPLVREATRRTLRSLGYQVVGAKSAEDALRLVAEQGESIRLVMTDVMMPGMNGLELARELGKIRPSLKILFISGYTAGVLAERGFLSENINFVQKPVSREALAQRLRELLDGPRQ